MRREMDVPEQLEAYLASQPEPKQADLRRLHAHILAEFPGCRLWFTDGTNADGKVVANPNIGYGAYTITYADGSSREFYRAEYSRLALGLPRHGTCERMPQFCAAAQPELTLLSRR